MSSVSIKCNDNLAELKKLPSGSVNLEYIDPPFKTGRDFGEYDDSWKSTSEYIEFMKPRLVEAKRVLKKDGSIYVHVDHHASHHVKLLLDEIFGEKNFVNEIIWKRKNASAVVRSKASSFGNNHDVIFLYSNGGKPAFTLIEQEVELDNGSFLRDPDGKPFKSKPMGGNVPTTVQRMLDDGTAYITKNGKPRIKKYLDERDGRVFETRPIDNVWTDIRHMGNTRRDERTGYPTQKPEKLLERIITASSKPGDVVLDFFAGSGTTCSVAKKLGRKSICIDQNPKACEIMDERLK